MDGQMLDARFWMLDGSADGSRRQDRVSTIEYPTPSHPTIQSFLSGQKAFAVTRPVA